MIIFNLLTVYNIACMPKMSVTKKNYSDENLEKPDAGKFNFLKNYNPTIFTLKAKIS